MQYTGSLFDRFRSLIQWRSGRVSQETGNDYKKIERVGSVLQGRSRAVIRISFFFIINTPAIKPEKSHGALANKNNLESFQRLF